MTYGLGERDTPAAERPGAARIALGLAVLAGERVGAGTAYRGGVATALGLLRQGSTAARHAAGLAGDRVARAGGRLLPTGLLRRTRDRLADAEQVGRATAAASRADAVAFLWATVDDGVAWAQVRIIPKIIDGLVPHLVAEVVPRIIDGAMPDIRERVLPVVIEDLTDDPQIREFVVEQSRGAIGEATNRLRATTATADDRVEAAFRRLIGRERNAGPA
ncbi:MAG TPA: hypothetical protein VFC00_16380 [Micromonosporaceae bacterium]|nr:hypothetical protein [Micromonosporaceae bacterium]